jgi:hypothetical protein
MKIFGFDFIHQTFNRRPHSAFFQEFFLQDRAAILVKPTPVGIDNDPALLFWV